MVRSVRAAALVLSTLVASVALAGPDWQEQGDAGKFVGNAQQTLGVGAINSISGEFAAGLLDSDFEDMYLVSITNPSAFSITVNSSNGTVGLFLFNVTLGNEGLGLVATIAGAGTLGNASNDGSLAAVNSPGIYALAIAVPGRYPVSNLGPIFNFANPNEVSGPDGSGGFLPHTDWAGTPGPIGDYGIELTGSGFFAVPAPGAGVVLGVCGLVAMRRRRAGA
ncbi:MAG: hypothetical protein U0640_11930 [Phycisphaerales bacterium]